MASNPINESSRKVLIKQCSQVKVFLESGAFIQNYLWIPRHHTVKPSKELERKSRI